jgi:hypothetical protein
MRAREVAVAIKLIIAGLRRSGTTIFWETFRQDRRLLCYDEPFNRYLQVLPGRQGLKAPEEFIRLVNKDASVFWERFTPIYYTEELREGLSDKQLDYLRFLADSGKRVALDTTRCMFKFAALRQAAPEAVLVHLYRPAPSHASSHMLPSSPDWRGRIRKLVRRRRFWERADGFNAWGFETIIGETTASPFARRLEESGLDAPAVYRMPAVARLMAYWKINYERAEADGRRLFGERFVSQSFDSFCEHPRAAMERIYSVLGMSPPVLDYGRIHPPHGAHDPGSPRWREYMELLGIPEV